MTSADVSKALAELLQEIGSDDPRLANLRRQQLRRRNSEPPVQTQSRPTKSRLSVRFRTPSQDSTKSDTQKPDDAAPSRGGRLFRMPSLTRKRSQSPSSVERPITPPVKEPKIKPSRGPSAGSVIIHNLANALGDVSARTWTAKTETQLMLEREADELAREQQRQNGELESFDKVRNMLERRDSYTGLGNTGQSSETEKKQLSSLKHAAKMAELEKRIALARAGTKKPEDKGPTYEEQVKQKALEMELNRLHIFELRLKQRKAVQAEMAEMQKKLQGFGLTAQFARDPNAKSISGSILPELLPSHARERRSSSRSSFHVDDELFNSSRVADLDYPHSGRRSPGDSDFGGFDDGYGNAVGSGTDTPLFGVSARDDFFAADPMRPSSSRSRSMEPRGLRTPAGTYLRMREDTPLLQPGDWAGTSFANAGSSLGIHNHLTAPYASAQHRADLLARHEATVLAAQVRDQDARLQSDHRARTARALQAKAKEDAAASIALTQQAADAKKVHDKAALQKKLLAELAELEQLKREQDDIKLREERLRQQEQLEQLERLQTMLQKNPNMAIPGLDLRRLAASNDSELLKLALQHVDSKADARRVLPPVTATRAGSNTRWPPDPVLRDQVLKSAQAQMLRDFLRQTPQKQHLQMQQIPRDRRREILRQAMAIADEKQSMALQEQFMHYLEQQESQALERDITLREQVLKSKYAPIFREFVNMAPSKQLVTFEAVPQQDRQDFLRKAMAIASEQQALDLRERYLSKFELPNAESSGQMTIAARNAEPAIVAESRGAPIYEPIRVAAPAAIVRPDRPNRDVRRRPPSDDGDVSDGNALLMLPSPPTMTPIVRNVAGHPIGAASPHTMALDAEARAIAEEKRRLEFEEAAASATQHIRTSDLDAEHDSRDQEDKHRAAQAQKAMQAAQTLQAQREAAALLAAQQEEAAIKEEIRQLELEEARLIALEQEAVSHSQHEMKQLTPAASSLSAANPKDVGDTASLAAPLVADAAFIVADHFEHDPEPVLSGSAMNDDSLPAGLQSPGLAALPTPTVVTDPQSKSFTPSLSVIGAGNATAHTSPQGLDQPLEDVLVQAQGEVDLLNAEPAAGSVQSVATLASPAKSTTRSPSLAVMSPLRADSSKPEVAASLSPRSLRSPVMVPRANLLSPSRALAIEATAGTPLPFENATENAEADLQRLLSPQKSRSMTPSVRGTATPRNPACASPELQGQEAEPHSMHLEARMSPAAAARTPVGQVAALSPAARTPKTVATPAMSAISRAPSQVGDRWQALPAKSASPAVSTATVKTALSPSAASIASAPDAGPNGALNPARVHGNADDVVRPPSQRPTPRSSGAQLSRQLPSNMSIHEGAAVQTPQAVLLHSDPATTSRRPSPAAQSPALAASPARSLQLPAMPPATNANHGWPESQMSPRKSSPGLVGTTSPAQLSWHDTDKAGTPVIQAEMNPGRQFHMNYDDASQGPANVSAWPSVGPSPAFGLKGSYLSQAQDSLAGWGEGIQTPHTANKGSDPVVVSLAEAARTPQPSESHADSHEARRSARDEEIRYDPYDDGEHDSNDSHFEPADFPIFMDGEELDEGMVILHEPAPHGFQEIYPKANDDVTSTAILNHLATMAHDHGFDALIKVALLETADAISVQGYFVRFEYAEADDNLPEPEPGHQASQRTPSKRATVADASEAGWA